MLGIQVRKGKAEGLKKYLQRNGRLDSKHKVFGGNSFIYFPVSGERDPELDGKAKEFGARVVTRDFAAIPGRMQRIPLSQKGAAKGYDLFGSIALIDAEPSAAKRMAKKLMGSNSNIKTVLRKGGPLTGTYRTRKFIFVGGARNYLAEYKENGCTFRFDVRKVFFSPRLSYERKRVSELVRDGENVMVMFAGVGPFAIEIAKKHKRCKVVAIELNRAACVYMKENIKLNKTNSVVCEVGDVNRFVAKYSRFADRIVMPLPKDSPSFIPAAIKMAKKNCTIHFYHFCPQEKVDETMGKMKSLIESRGASVKGMSHRTVVPYSSSEVEIVIDFRVNVKKL